MLHPLVFFLFSWGCASKSPPTLPYDDVLICASPVHRDRTNLKLQETTTLKPKCWVLHCCASLHSGSNRSLFVLIIEILGKLPCIDRRAQMVCTVIKLNNVQNADELTSAIMLSSKKSGVPNAGNSFISGWAALWTLWICYLEPVHAVRGRQ